MKETKMGLNRIMDKWQWMGIGVTVLIAIFYVIMTIYMI